MRALGLGVTVSDDFFKEIVTRARLRLDLGNVGRCVWFGDYSEFFAH
jgi:hypothetical protein